MFVAQIVESIKTVPDRTVTELNKHSHDVHFNENREHHKHKVDIHQNNS